MQTVVGEERDANAKNGILGDGVNRVPFIETGTPKQE